jgi:hypothetical protein
MSGAFVCACSALRVETMVERLISASDPLSGDLGRRDKSGRWSGDACLSRAERLEIISLVTAVGMSECSAWIIPMLERGALDEDPKTERMKC